MKIAALVKIELALDGTWRIMQIESAQVPAKHLSKLWGSGDEPQKATEYLANAQSVREHQRAASAVRAHARSYPTHGHCSICGRCGKKSSTHRTGPGLMDHYHVGPPLPAAEGC